MINMADIADIVEQVSQRLKEIRKELLAWSLRQCSTQDRESSQSPGYVNLVTPHHTKSSRVEGWVERKAKKYTISGECSK